MKLIHSLIYLLGLVAVFVRGDEVCHSSVVTACSSSSLAGSSICDARFSGIAHIEPEAQAYINSLLLKSFDYLLMATNFNSYQKDRQGFHKLYKQMSDRSFADGIELIKQVTRRGGIADFNARHEVITSISRRRPIFEVDELHSLAIALDSEKHLANGAAHIHTRATHNPERDPEMAHFIEEKFLGKQAESVRKLSGYVNDLAKMLKTPDPSLSIYLFDEYLGKQ